MSGSDRKIPPLILLKFHKFFKSALFNIFFNTWNSILNVHDKLCHMNFVLT